MGSVRETLRTHQFVTVLFPLPDWRLLKLRIATTREPEHVGDLQRFGHTDGTRKAEEGVGQAAIVTSGENQPALITPRTP